MANNGRLYLHMIGRTLKRCSTGDMGMLIFSAHDSMIMMTCEGLYDSSYSIIPLKGVFDETLLFKYLNQFLMRTF